ncbi:CGNR zinc finger domain-containing protein [Streptomyces parvulus]|uniref:CGNR zinc finger domain-containing protein n=1 Tax=Streptomyces parvulus TaxID=146923 RepID=UPI0033EC4D3D
MDATSSVSSLAAPSTAPPVPRSAWTLIEIANSRELSIRPDLLAAPADAVGLFGELALLPAPGRSDEAALDEVRTFRALLNRLLVDHDDTDAWTALNTLSRQAVLNVDFAPGGTVLTAAPGADRPLTRLVIHLHRTVNDGTWSRIRLCANEECSAAFYDTTRSRTQRWHSYADCGNKSNVAAHRSRTRAARTG